MAVFSIGMTLLPAITLLVYGFERYQKIEGTVGVFQHRVEYLSALLGV
jgi:hypothetical protein